MAQPEYYPDITRPGDPNFTSFPKHLAEDCVRYTIHISTPLPLSVPALRSRLLGIQKAAKVLCKTLLSDYIWQREEFALELVSNLNDEPLAEKSGIGAKKQPDQPSKALAAQGNDLLRTWHLSGQTCYGESIADEWLIVFLLRKLSEQFEDAWIRVVDADGEFLLVEAAMVLPKWLNPEVADHRVWLHKGQLRIIPRTLSGEKPSKAASVNMEKRPTQNLPRELSLSDALMFITRQPEALLHSPLIEEEAFFRIRKFPATILESLHTARLSLPRNLAYILHEQPAYISAAVDAFYLRDPISLRTLKTTTKGELRFPPKDLVTVSVKFTRVSYAQLKSQQFTPPDYWTSPLRTVERTDEWTRREMGMKVACGFEMLLADPLNKDKRAVRETEILLEDIASGEEDLPSNEEVKTWPIIEDSEKWLDVNFEDFEKELSGRSKGNRNAKVNGNAGGFGDKSAQEQLQKMVERFEHFLNDEEAGVDGAELSDEMDDDNDNDDSDVDSEDPEEDRDVSFDEEEFANMMKQMMGMPSGNNLPRNDISGSTRVQELDSNSDSDEEDMQHAMNRMEAELRDAGALDPDRYNDAGEETSDNHKYVLAKNLLDSLKGQVGAPGPAGNLMSSMGLRLPRHEDES